MPRASKPAVYEGEMDLGALAFAPETYKADGGFKGPASITLQLLHQGHEPVELSKFLPKVRGQVHVTIRAGDGLEDWVGTGALGKTSIDFPAVGDRAKESGAGEYLVARIPLKVSAALDQRKLDTLESLMSLRCAMSAREQRTATVRIQPWQEDLPLDGGEDGEE